jgi:hypothetical protein
MRSAVRRGRRERIRRREWSGGFEAGRDMRAGAETRKQPTSWPPAEGKGPTCQHRLLFIDCVND